MRLRARPLSVAVLGGGCLAAALLLWAPGGFNLRENIREVIFDRALPLLASPPETSPVVVVDIDRESLARYGAWP
jgi:CHASE2 domain-containing sensor protein